MSKIILSFHCGVAGGDSAFSVISVEFVSRRIEGVPSNQAKEYSVDYIVRRNGDGSEQTLSSFSHYSGNIVGALPTRANGQQAGGVKRLSKTIRVSGSLIVSKDPKLIDRFMVEGRSRLRFQISAVGESEINSPITITTEYVAIEVQLKHRKATCRLE